MCHLYVLADGIEKMVNPVEALTYTQQLMSLNTESNSTDVGLEEFMRQQFWPAEYVDVHTKQPRHDGLKILHRESANTNQL